MKTVVFEWKGVEYHFHIGRNQSENWDILDKAHEWDVWFHVSDSPSSHVILTLEREEDSKLREIPRAVLKKGALLCKSHSSSKSTAQCPVIYTAVRRLTKGRAVGSVSISGEYKTIVL